VTLTLTQAIRKNICNVVHILQEDVERYYKAYQNFAKAIIYSPDTVGINRHVQSHVYHYH